MVALLIALSTASSSSAAALFDAAVAANNEASRATVSISVDSKYGTQFVQTRYQVAYIRPDTVRLVATEIRPRPSKRTYFLKGPKLVAYDTDLNEVMRTGVVPTGSLAQRVLAALGRMEDAVQTVLEPKVAENLFARFRRTVGWKFGSHNGFRTMQLRSANGTTTFAFDRRSHLLRRFSITMPRGFVQWRIDYGPAPSQVNYSAPQFARPVSALSAPVEPPKYTDAQSKRVAQACVAALDRLRSAEFEVDSEGRTSHVWVSNSKVRESRGSLDWGYDGRNLWVADKALNKAWLGATSPAKIAAILNALNIPSETFVQQIVQGRNPMRPILVPGSSARAVGTVRLAGSTCDILEVSASGIKISVCVRRQDHLPADLMSDFVDNSGHKLGGSHRAIRYFHVGKRIPASVFRSRIHAGMPVFKLPQAR